MQHLNRNLQKALLAFIILPLQVLATEPLIGFECPDEAMRQDIIQDSIKAYKGSCPCPYSVDEAGKTCGDQSAYSKQGVKAVYCYNSDISDEMVKKKCSETIF